MKLPYPLWFFSSISVSVYHCLVPPLLQLSSSLFFKVLSSFSIISWSSWLIYLYYLSNLSDGLLYPYIRIQKGRDNHPTDVLGTPLFCVITLRAFVRLSKTSGRNYKTVKYKGTSNMIYIRWKRRNKSSYGSKPNKYSFLCWFKHHQMATFPTSTWQD